VHSLGIPIKKASAMLGIKQATAKSICRVYTKQNRVNKTSKWDGLNALGQDPMPTHLSTAH
jgi:hypothetical protein